MAETLEFFFDFSCPYAYLASVRVESLAQRTGSELVLRPVLLGGVFRARGVAQNLAGTLGEAKAKHNMQDLQRWADLFGLPLRFPQQHPQRTVTALRCLLVVGLEDMSLVHRFYRAYWQEGLDFSSDEVIGRLLAEEGHDAEAVLGASGSQEIKDELRRRTDDALAHGIFGVPSFLVREALYWGQDRMDRVERALGGEVSLPALATDHAGQLHPVDFFFDYSSPFAYLASTQACRYFGSALRWRPMLLGAVFKMVGAPNVPLFTMSEAKQAWISEDLNRRAAEFGVAMRWPSRFPLRTLLPLRATLLVLQEEPGRAQAFIQAVFGALWHEDADPDDPDTIAALADGVGLSGSVLVRQAGEDLAKALLHRSTAEAVGAGVFGAPTCVVRPSDREESLFWGCDRLGLALTAAREA